MYCWELYENEKTARDVCKKIAGDLDACANDAMYACIACGYASFHDYLVNEKHTCPYCDKPFEPESEYPLTMSNFFNKNFIDVEYCVDDARMLKSVRVRLMSENNVIYVDTRCTDIDIRGKHYYHTGKVMCLGIKKEKTYPISKHTCSVINDCFNDLYKRVEGPYSKAPTRLVIN